MVGLCATFTLLENFSEIQSRDKYPRFSAINLPSLGLNPNVILGDAIERDYHFSKIEEPSIQLLPSTAALYCFFWLRVLNEYFTTLNSTTMDF